MLSRQLRAWRWWPLAIGAIFVTFLIGCQIGAFSCGAPRQNVADSAQSAGTQQAKVNSVPGWPSLSPEEREARSDNTIANFTIVLAVVGFVQGAVLIWQTTILNREFLATHRPELFIREIRWDFSASPTDPTDVHEVIAFVLVNRGRSAAKIVASAFKLATSSGDGVSVEIGTENDLGIVSLAPGEFKRFNYTAPGFEAAAQKLKWLSDHFFRGAIVYADRAGIKRRFAFTRKCVRGVDYFLPTGQAEDEYTD
jgi:hypothetical protein